MNNLVDEFFKRNLNEAEAQGLEELLEKSPEDALDFGNRMEREYLAMGLVVPSMPKHFKLGAPHGGSLFLKLFLTTLALTTAGLLAWRIWPQPQAVLTQPLEKPLAPVLLSKPKAKLPPPPLEIPRRLEGLSEEGNRLSVVVELDHSAPVQVDILDSKGQTVRSLYQGSLQAGKWSLRWDGLLSDGARAPAGDYLIRVKSGSNEMTKNVAIEPGK